MSRKAQTENGRFFVAGDDETEDYATFDEAADAAKEDAKKHGETRAIYKLVALIKLGDPPVTVERF